MRIGDAVRLKADSPLRARLTPFADELGEVVDTYQDDDEGLRTSPWPTPTSFTAWLAPLSVEDFAIVPQTCGGAF